MLHKFSSGIWLVILVGFTPRLLGAAPSSSDTLVAMKGGVTVARGEVVSVDSSASRTSVKATVRITLVLSGDPGLTGSAFGDFSVGLAGQDGSFSNEYTHADPPLASEQVGWWRLWRDDKGRLRTGGNPDEGLNLFRTMPVRWPLRPGDVDTHQPHALTFDDLEAMAPIVEAVRAAPGEQDRLAIILKAIASENEFLSAWGVDIAVRGAPQLREAVAANLRAGSLGIVAQVAYDQAMLQADRDQWIDSGSRREMMKGWFVPSRSVKDASTAARYLDLATYTRGLTAAILEEVVRGALLEERFSVSAPFVTPTGTLLSACVHAVQFGGGAERAAIGVLLDTAAQGPSSARIGSALMLADFVNRLQEPEVQRLAAILAELQAAEANPDMRRHLETALSAVEAKKPDR